jgi:aerobic carbon-monoxide dehydrogenase large subunit
MKRREDKCLITGHGSYVDDFKFPGLLYASFVRSSYAHARIKSVDLQRARESAEVVFATSGLEIEKETKPLPAELELPGLKKTPLYMLATRKAHFVGEPIAVVLARSRYSAEDAAEKVEVEYEPLECVIDAEKAMENDSPLLYENWNSNELLTFRLNLGSVKEALEKSDYVSKHKIVRHRYTAAPMECRGYLASYDKFTGVLTYYASTQMPHILRSLISKSLDFPEHRIRVIAPNVGGAFGLKAPMYQEEPLIAYLSLKTGSPVKWIETRSENLTAACHSREQIHYMEMGVSKDGTITAIRDNMIADLGAYSALPGLHSALATARFVPSGYRISNYEITLHAIQTNKAPYGAVRGFGKADANFAIERMVDLAAREMGFDPLQFRLKNLVPTEEFPYQSCTGSIYDSGNYQGNMMKAAEAIHYANFRREQKELWQRGIYRGISVSFMIEPSGLSAPNSFFTGYDAATLRIDPSGKVSVLVGVAAQGQGHETAISQIVADELALQPEDILVMEGDSFVSPYGLGAFASRFAIQGVGSILKACEKIRGKLLLIASGVLKCGESELVFEEGHVRSVRDGSKAISIGEIAEIAYTRIHLLPRGVEPGLEETAHYVSSGNVTHVPDSKGRISSYPSITAGAYAVIVDVDVRTGKVKIVDQVLLSDCGNIINPLTLDGLLEGGVIQGIGGAFFEELPYDQTGQLQSGTFMDYLLPTALDSPDVKILHMTTPSPFTLGGFKGGAEGGSIPPPYGLTSAVEDALTPFKTSMMAQPLSPENVWLTIRGSH